MAGFAGARRLVLAAAGLVDFFAAGFLVAGFLVTALFAAGALAAVFLVAVFAVFVVLRAAVVFDLALLFKYCVQVKL